jgi:hypothetical protein
MLIWFHRSRIRMQRKIQAHPSNSIGLKKKNLNRTNQKSKSASRRERCSRTTKTKTKCHCLEGRNGNLFSTKEAKTKEVWEQWWRLVMVSNKRATRNWFRFVELLNQMLYR